MRYMHFPGARWWKFDFHAHTPASDDFLKGCTKQVKEEVTPEYWLRKFMEQGIDCVAITDHNSGGWLDRLQHKLQDLDLAEAKPEWYRPLYLFPGVEISAHGGVHILAIFGRDEEGTDIESLLAEVGYRGTRGKSDAVTSKSITDVIDKISELGAIAIPAHVDKRNGLFEQPHIPTLKQMLENTSICAIELLDDNYEKPQLYSQKPLKWSEVKGSDTHNFRDPSFGNFTWVKMDEPSIEGLRLALMDGAASVNRNMSDDPNRYADSVIEEIQISDAKYIGRSDALCCQFSPFLNTIIGGRGSGKSTLLEFMRLVLQRVGDLPDDLTKESQRYFSDGGDSLLASGSQISMIYRKEAARYRLIWSAKTDLHSLEVQDEGAWKTTPGEIRSLFPARIYNLWC